MAPNEPLLSDPYVAAQPESMPFWKAAEEGRLLGKFCPQCQRFHWYPRAICPFCGSLSTEWRPLKGTGTLYAFSTLRRAAIPYTVAYVTLSEGPTVLTALVGTEITEPRIDMPVRALFHPTPDGRHAPRFTTSA